MNYIHAAAALSLASIAAGCSAPSDEPTQQAAAVTPIASGDLLLSDGKSVGAVKIVAESGTVSLLVAISGLPKGTHGFHLHQTGECTDPDFKSAGGHLNPLGKNHGTESEGGSHVGDLPNLELGGTDAEPQTFVIEGSETQISEWVLDEDGTAVVIHANPDDYKTDPSGAAGARIACAVLSAS